jgi:histidinol-phosphate aminotransferase/threonine-phosphate decarboxylase
MDPEAVDGLGDAAQSACTVFPFGRSVDAACFGHADTESQTLDFSTIVNTEAPDGVGQVYESALAAARSYPPDDYAGFRATAAAHVGCEATQIIPAAGRLDGMRLAMATTVSPGDDVLLPTPNCREYAQEVRLQGGNPTFRHHTALLDTDPAGAQLVCLSRPHNPTGHAYDPAVVRTYADRCREAETPLLIDESFLGFTDCDSLAGYLGVIVVRSLSELAGFPGIPSGFLVARGPLRERLDTARLTWGLGVPGREVGQYCLEQTAFLDATKARIREERARLTDRLAGRFEVHPSEAPYLLLELAGEESVPELTATLHESNITVRDARTFRGLDNHVRVTVRSPEENDALLDALGV